MAGFKLCSQRKPEQDNIRHGRVGSVVSKGEIGFVNRLGHWVCDPEYNVF